ncbi:MAG: tripartite tricarboxylate transporter TctB family protein, partial [Acidobacteria bacterium]|nr:tripartite tricarboxylate transporter TctB family protein [Acidobacteriota bacterium]
MTMNSDRVSALIFLAFSIAYGVMAQDINLYFGWEEEAFTARTFPTALAWAGAGVSLLLLVVPSEGSRALSLSAIRRYDWWRFLLLCGLMLVYGLTIQTVGFFLSTSLFLLIGYLILGERR